jgi:hypothetical protein
VFTGRYVDVLVITRTAVFLFFSLVFFCFLKQLLRMSRYKFGGYLQSSTGIETTVLNVLSGYPFQRKVEAAGERYEYIKSKVLLKEYIDNDEKPDQIAEEDTEDNKEQSANYEKKRHKKNEIMRSLLNDDPYEIMGLGHLRWRATEEDIRSACK